jgi:hypothetical protein
MSFFKFLFLPNQLESKKPFDYDKDDYENLKKGQLELHKDYLKDMELEENARLGTIENKTSQLVSQTGLVFALLSLFVPFIVDIVFKLHIGFRILFIVLLICCFLAYIFAFVNSLKNFNVKKFEYGYKSPLTILKHQSLGEKKFLQMEIRDALYCINKNIEVNNRKATNLIRGYHFFKFGIISTSILVVFLCSTLLFTDAEKNKIVIEKPIEINSLKEHLDYIKDKDQGIQKVQDSITKVNLN